MSCYFALETHVCYYFTVYNFIWFGYSSTFVSIYDFENFNVCLNTVERGSLTFKYFFFYFMVMKKIL